MNSMDDTEKAKLKAWVEQWKETGKVLERDRKQQIINANTQNFLHNIEGMVHAYFNKNDMRKMSGLVEQQLYFRKL